MHRNRHRVNTVIQKPWSPRKRWAIPKDKSPEHLFQSPEKPVELWPLNSTGFGAYTCRQGESTCTVSCTKLQTNVSVFWMWLPTADCYLGAVWEQLRRAKHGLAYPALGITASGIAQHYSSSATSSCPGESRWAELCSQHWKGSPCRVDNCTRIQLHGRSRFLFILTGEPFLPVSFWLAHSNSIQFWCLFAHLVSISMWC